MVNMDHHSSPAFEVVQSVRLHGAPEPKILKLSADGGLLAVVDGKNCVHIISTEGSDWKVQYTFGARMDVVDFFWHKEIRRHLMIAGRDGTIIIGKLRRDLRAGCKILHQYELTAFTETGPVQKIVLNENGTQMAAIRGRSLCIYGSPFHDKFSFSATIAIPPADVEEYQLFRASAIAGLDYIGDELLIVSFTAGFLIISTAVPYHIVNRILAPPANRSMWLYRRTESSVSPHGGDMTIIPSITALFANHALIGFVAS
ncbi:hypothetical protein NLJ89_g10911 [Agrocybe chaxingu]|uniref:Uncharacterized protein n=1 Tax=Agrocybe chaxingu TaxID=84603 RepID=A0A9W8JQC4_9AGAR|nr:hypothetical protein NLJ89_g10911 [Agrocybe chaxingu]